jgi:hypothetical protein
LVAHNVVCVRLQVLRFVQDDKLREEVTEFCIRGAVMRVLNAREFFCAHL